MRRLDGATAAFGQMDDVLADLASFAADLPAAAQLLDDTHVRVRRVLRDTVDGAPMPITETPGHPHWGAHRDA